MNSEQFDKYFQSNLAEHEVKPPTDLWEGVEANLPTRPLSNKRWLIGTAMLVLLLLIGSITFFNNYQIEINQKNGLHTAFDTKEKVQPNNFIHSNLPTKDYFSEFTNIFTLNKQRLLMRLNSFRPQSAQQNNTNQKENIDEFDEALTHLIAFNEELPAPEKKVNNLLFQKNTQPLSFFNFGQFNNRLDYILLKSFTQSDARVQSSVAEIAKVDEETSVSLNELAVLEAIEIAPQNESNTSDGWYSGPTYQSQWSWLVNQNVNASRSGSTNTMTQMALPGNAFGVMVGYDFNKRAGIQMEWILNSEQGFDFVNFNDRGETSYEYRQNLNYMLFPVLFKYSKEYENQVFGKTLALNHLVGLQYGYLRDAHSYVNGEYVKADWRNRSSLGLVVGMGYDVYLTNQASFSIGARSTFGKSLYNLEGILNDDQLYNVHFGVNASLRYNFNK